MTQLDIFGKVLAAVAQDEALTARFKEFTASDAGARCWVCGRVEATPFALGVNHGLWAYDPVSVQRTVCWRKDRAAFGREPAGLRWVAS